MRILYGMEYKQLDVTDIALKTCVLDGKLYIPPSEQRRSEMFSDPMPHYAKYIQISEKEIEETPEEEIVKRIFNSQETIHFDPTINIESIPERMDLKRELQQLISSCQVWEGSREHQMLLLVLTFVRKEARVLEVGGGGSGITSLVISAVLSDDHNLVVLEPNAFAFDRLAVTRELNQKTFRTEEAALCAPVRQIGFQELESKYGIVFDTLVVECCAGFLESLRNSHGMLDLIQMIIIKNEFTDPCQKETVDEIFYFNGFRRFHAESGGRGLEYSPDMFVVWIR